MTALLFDLYIEIRSRPQLGLLLRHINKLSWIFIGYSIAS